MFNQIKVILLVLMVPVIYVSCGNVLYISSLPSPSHHLWNKVLSMSLIKNGHNVTMLSPDKEQNPIANFSVITMEGMYEVLRQNFKIEESFDKNTFVFIKEIYDFVGFLCENYMSTKGLETLLNYPEDFKFDLVIFDVTNGHCLYPIIEKFHNPPVVGVTAFLLPSTISHSLGNHLHTSYVPYYNSGFTAKMSFVQRVLNFIYTYFDVILRNYYSVPKEFKIAKKRFGDDIRSIEEIERNITILLANTDPILNQPIALPPNIIPVGGLHVRPGQALPKDLKKIMDGAKHGVILFSLGTNVRSADLSPVLKQAFLGAFAKLPETILWKFEMDTLEGLPKNVVIRKWLPQNDILAHPNTKLFINHGGALSTQEAIYHGIPVIGIPFFGDQFINTQQMKERGIAEQLDVRDNLTTDDIHEKIKLVLNSDKYKENIRKISKLYRDQPQTALERAVFWIEYVLRHGTAEHLTLRSRDMPGYQTANLDVLAIFVLSIVLVYSLFTLILTACRLSFTKRSTKTKSTK